MAGKRVGPAEFESALLSHPAVLEAAAVGVPHALKGETVWCYAVLKPDQHPTEAVRQELLDTVVRVMGKAFKPDKVRFVTVLLGPAPAPVERLKGRYRWHLLLKSKESRTLHALVRKGKETILARAKAQGIRVIVDVDPYSML